MSKSIKIFLALAISAVTVWSFRIPPDAKFQRPDLARILVWHLPCAILCALLLFVGAWFAHKYLKTRDRVWDERTVTIHELSMTFSIATMSTGILFSEAQWGAWWSWDPRQTSFLIVMFVYAAYFVLRSSISDPEKRAANSAAYALSALLPALFLIFALPRILMSLHPNDTISGGNLKGQYLYMVLANMVLFSILSVWLYRLRVEAGLIAIDSELDNGQLATGSSDPTPTGVVRPVRLSVED